VGWKDVRTVEVFKAAGSIVSVTTMPQQTLKALLGNSLTGEQYQLLCYSSVVDMMVDRCLERNVDTVCEAAIDSFHGHCCMADGVFREIGVVGFSLYIDSKHNVFRAK
jgi:hypothetical protein